MQYGISQSVSKMVCVPALLGLLRFVPLHLVPPTPVPYAKRPLTRSLRLEYTSWGTSLPSFQTSALVCRSCPTMDKMDASAWSKMFGSKPDEGMGQDSRSTKRIAVSADTNIRAIQDKAELALRLATIATQRLREDEAIICSSIPLKKSGPLFQALSASHTEYIKEVKGKKGHGLGDGSTYKFGAVLLVLAQQLPDSAQKATVTQAVADYAPKSKIALQTIRMCKTEVMHDSSMARFKLAIPGDSKFENAVIEGIEMLESVQQWYGPRAAGYLEKQAQSSFSGS